MGFGGCVEESSEYFRGVEDSVDVGTYDVSTYGSVLRLVAFVVGRLSFCCKVPRTGGGLVVDVYEGCKVVGDAGGYAGVDFVAGSGGVFAS